jgi:hypothetical protein
MTADVPAPLVGRTTLTAADAAVLFKANSTRIGFFSQPRMLAYSAEFAIVAAALGLAGYRLAAEVLLGIAVLFFGLAIWAGKRATRLVLDDLAYGQEGEIELDDEGVTVRQPGLTSRWMWSRFVSAVAAPDHIALITGVGAVVVFARSFDADTFVRVHELVARKLPTPAQP